MLPAANTPGATRRKIIAVCMAILLGWASTAPVAEAIVGNYVTYDGNSHMDGDPPVDANPYLQGDTVVIAGSGTLTRGPYTFAGWNTKANPAGINDGTDDGITYSPGAELEMPDSNVTLYAVWLGENYTRSLTYDGNGNDGGTVPLDNTAYPIGNVVTKVKDNLGALVKTGFTFDGWNTEADGTGTHYDENAMLTMEGGAGSNYTLYAQWTADSGYTVTYDGNSHMDGDPPVDANPYLQGDTVVIAGSGTLTRGPYTFGGWNTKANPAGINDGTDDGITYSPGAELEMPDSNVTLYAVWLGENYTRSLTYDGNGNDGGTVPIDSTAYPIGNVVTKVKDNSGSLVKTGFTFDGWNTEADGTGTHYDENAMLTMEGGVGSNYTLYAQWTADSGYTVTYDGNSHMDGDPPVDASSYSEGDTVVIAGSGTLTRGPYTFGGWNTKANPAGINDGTDDGITYSPGAELEMPDSNVTLYAVWLGENYTRSLTYDGNGNDGGTVPVDSTAYPIGNVVTKVKDNSGSLVKTGFTFDGWNTEADGTGTHYDENAMLTMEGGVGSNYTLYAQWTADSGYTVTYDGNGHTGGTVPVDNGTYEESVTVSVYGNTGSLVKTSHVFTGWNTADDGSGTSYDENDTFAMGSANVTLYAQWVPVFTVTYDGNGHTGGTVPVDNGTYGESVTVSVYGNTGALVKTGHIFDGWNTADDGSGSAYDENDTFAMGSANVTLYAQWVPVFTVTYDGNGHTGGTVPVDNGTYEESVTVSVYGNTGSLVKTSHVFTGWNTADDGSGSAYDEDDTFAMGSADVTLYAQWIPVFTVTYDGNEHTGGTVPVDNGTYEESVTVSVYGNTGSLVKTDHIFIGWNTAADGSGSAYDEDDTFAMGSADVTLYAQWIPVFTVTYDGNGNTGGTAPVDSGTYEESVTVSVYGNTGSLLKTGHIFAGWNTAADGSGSAYDEDDTFAMGSANVTLYAQWVPVFTVTYDGNGHSGGTVPVDNETYEESVTVSVYGNTGSLVKTGHIFTGWNTAADGSGSAYDENDTFAMGSANVTLYAQWVPVFTVTYNGNGNSGGTVPVDNGTYEESVTVSVYGNTGSLVKTSHVFTGWNTAADGSGSAYDEDDTFPMGSANVTLYAQWTPVFTVTYNGNGNSGGSAPVDNGVYAENATVSVYGNPGALARAGYTFDGWNTTASGNGTSYVENGTFPMGAANVTLYARWTPIPVFPVAIIETSPIVKLVLESNPDQEGESAKTGITQVVGASLTLSAKLLTLDGQETDIPDISVNEKGEFSIADVPAGEYKVAIYVIAPTGEKLAGRYGKLTVQSDGNAVLESDLIDPYGIITDVVTGEVINDAKVTLHWSDTELNRSKGRVPHELVILPILPDFAPNQNHDPQWSKDGGQYGWMVFPDGDYYILAEKDGYLLFDSRLDPRDEQQGDDSYIKDGIIHVGVSIVEYNFEMQPIGSHKLYMAGYPDGSYLPERGISRAEMAAVLSRLFVPGKPATDKVSFPDVARTHWAASAIQLAAQQGWMSGDANGEFHPEQFVTRAEFAEIIMNVKKWRNTSASSFSDVQGHRAEAAIAAMEEQQLVRGYSDGTFKPDQAITRAESNILFNQLTGRNSRHLHVAPRWTDVSQTYWAYDAVMEASVNHTFTLGEDGSEMWDWE